MKVWLPLPHHFIASPIPASSNGIYNRLTFLPITITNSRQKYKTTWTGTKRRQEQEDIQTLNEGKHMCWDPHWPRALPNAHGPGGDSQAKGPSCWPESQNQNPGLSERLRMEQGNSMEKGATGWSPNICIQTFRSLADSCAAHVPGEKAKELSRKQQLEAWKCWVEMSTVAQHWKDSWGFTPLQCRGLGKHSTEILEGP